ncbi:MAG: hypothetical protein OXT06_14620 [Rhodospirillaceae bacterium]|nr:hypothetical protein [Rhodospirillaceae bacterium]
MPQPGASYGVPFKRVRAYIVFQGGVSPHASLWSAFTDPGWRHCWLMLPAYHPAPGLMADRYTLKIEPLRWGIDTEVWWHDPEEVAQHFLDLNVTAVVALDVTTPPPGVPFIPRGLMTCVTVIKAALGIRAWHIWTPKALFRYVLHHHNGTLVQRETDGRHRQSDLQRTPEAERP